MPRPRCLAFLVFAIAAAAHAGIDEGEQAFKRRDYRSALSEFTPLADGGVVRPVSGPDLYRITGFCLAD